MALILAFLGAIATLAGVALAACHALRMLTLVGGVLPIVPFIGMVGASLLAGGIAFFTFARIFGHPHYAGSLAGGGVAALACGYVLTSRILSLLGRRDAATQAVAGFSETARRPPRPSGLPRAFGPRNDGGLRSGALLRALGSLPRPFDNKGIRHGKAGETPSLRGAQRRGNPEDRRRKTEDSQLPALRAATRLSSVLCPLSSVLCTANAW